MKHYKFLYPISGFFAGIFVSLVFIGLVSFSPPGSSGTGIFPVSAETARSYISRYFSAAAPVNSVVRGFNIDRTQLDAMNAIIKENPALTGFRIYLGRNNNNVVQGIVVGVDGQGKDAVNNTIFGTDSKTVSPCPPACETSSPLIGQ
jgi:hypothetical protein